MDVGAEGLNRPVPGQRPQQAAEGDEGDDGGEEREREPERARHEVADVLRDALVRAKARREIAASTDVEALARFLTAGIQGLRLVGKAKPDRAALEDIAAVMLRCLDG